MTANYFKARKIQKNCPYNIGDLIFSFKSSNNYDKKKYAEKLHIQFKDRLSLPLNEAFKEIKIVD
jgi:hypothetical protein